MWFAYILVCQWLSPMKIKIIFTDITTVLSCTTQELYWVSLGKPHTEHRKMRKIYKQSVHCVQVNFNFLFFLWSVIIRNHIYFIILTNSIHWKINIVQSYWFFPQFYYDSVRLYEFLKGIFFLLNVYINCTVQLHFVICSPR